LSEAQATPLIGQYQLEDFYTDKPYAEVYNERNRFMQSVMLNKMRDLAVSLGFRGFMTQWKAYLSSQRSDQQIDDLSNDTAFEKQPMVLQCGSYTCTDRVTRINEFGMEVEVISHPIMPVKRVVNIETQEAKLEIAYIRGSKKDTAWKTCIVSREQLASSQRIISLANQDIAVNSENAKEVVRFLGLLESKNYDKLPLQNSVSHLGWLSDGSFMPFVENISYDGGSAEFSRICDSFKPTGSADKWMELVKSVRAGRSVPARIALAASFAAPLVSICNALPFFVHLWGTQGCGKTVGLMLAASVWGNPDLGAGYIKSFGGTKVSQELYAAFCGNVPVLLDELQVISDRKMFDDIIYMLCEGMSKGRGAKEGGLQLQRRWSTCMITTGEMPIVQSNSGGGAAVRTIEVNYGGEPLFDDARTVANMLKENYGFAGRVFVEALRDPEVVDAMKAQQKKFYSKLSGDIQDKQVLSASILLAADKLAEVLIFHDKKNLTVDEIRPYLVTQKEADINYRCYQWMLGYFAANLRRFDSDDTNGGEIWGTKKDNVTYVIKPIFERILRSEGYSPGAFLTWARRNRKILCDDYGEGSRNRRLTKRVTVGGRSTPCVAIIDNDEEEEAREEEKLEYDKYVQVEDADMPF